MWNFLTSRKKESEGLNNYRFLKEEAVRKLHIALDEVRAEFEDAISIPQAIYRQKSDSLRADFRRVEEELWKEYVAGE